MKNRETLNEVLDGDALTVNSVEDVGSQVFSLTEAREDLEELFNTDELLAVLKLYFESDEYTGGFTKEQAVELVLSEAGYTW